MRPTVHRGPDTREAGATPAGRQNEKEVTKYERNGSGQAMEDD